MIIHLNAFPGVGKLTTAKIMAKVLPARLMDNHAFINLAYLATEHGTPEYLDLLTKLWDDVADALVENKSIQNIIFTNALAAELKEDIERFNKVADLAKRRDEPFVPIKLTCDFKENAKRIIEAGRAEKQKLTNPKILKDMYKGYSIYHPDNKNSLEIDVTNKIPSDTASIIKFHCDAIMAQR